MSKFNEEITKEIIKLYNNGIPLKHCASAVGIDRRTLHRWMNRGKNARSGKYRRFYLDMQMARAKFIAFHQKKINESDDWKASRYLLEVTSPEDYVITEKQEHKVDANVAVLSDLFCEEDILRFIDESGINE